MPLRLVRRRLLLALAVLFAVYLGRSITGCAGPEPAGEPVAATDAPHAVVLVSLDGVRWDYLDRPDVEIPTLRWIAGGVRAGRLVPVFPTLTFPNHYSLVTGLHPQAHGIVGNTMRDPERLVEGEPARFSLSNREAIAEGAWWGGEPIWATAQRQALSSATLFWPGSEAEIAGQRPDRWLPYDGSMPYGARVDTVLAWLDAPDSPDLVTLYMEAVDSAGHEHGPDAPEVAEALARVDAALARLVDGLRARGRLDRTDIVVVSDHGMQARSRDRVVILDDAFDLDAHDIDWGATVGVWPAPGTDIDAIVARISALDHATAYRKGDVPARLRYRDNPRIPPVTILTDIGWTATSRAYLDRNSDRPSGGTHGWDNRHASMHGVFLARGPSVRSGTRLDSLHTVDVYGILATALGVEAAPNAGDAGTIDRVLR